MKISHEIIDMVRKLAPQAKSIRALARQIGISPPSVARILTTEEKKHFRKRKPYVTEAEVDQYCHLYNRGFSIAEIAKQLNRNRTNIRKHLKRRNYEPPKETAKYHLETPEVSEEQDAEITRKAIDTAIQERKTLDDWIAQEMKSIR